MVLKGFNKILKDYPQAGMVLFGIATEDVPVLNGQAPVKERTFICGYLSHSQTISLLSRLDLFLRATYFDGDANSVREALALNVPVVASNTDFRPDGVIKFEVGNNEDMVSKIDYALCNRENIRHELKNLPSQTTDNLEQLFNLYCQHI
jgi:glycosyltransferase involved in cell wall biosynthesis